MNIKAATAILFSAVLVFSLGGCSKKEPTMEDKIDAAADSVGDAARDAGDAVSDAAEDVGDAMNEAADDLEEKKNKKE